MELENHFILQISQWPEKQERPKPNIGCQTGKATVAIFLRSAGFFPAENPKYSCIVIIHKPSTKKGFYGADVSGPVFKRIAQKIFTDSPNIDSVEGVEKTDPVIEKDFEKYYAKLRQPAKTIPNVTGMAGMDAVSLLENLGLKVKVVGNGTVSSQSIKSGETLKKGQLITLNLS